MNPAAASSPWSPLQRRWLQALGHVVLRTGSVDVEAESETTTVTGLPSSIQAAAPGERPQAAPAEAAAGPALVAPAGPAPARPATGTASAEGAVERSLPVRRPAQMPDRLRLSLLRASGLDPADPAAQAQMAQWPVELLRGDAAAKRAFWPQLRALRRRPS